MQARFAMALIAAFSVGCATTNDDPIDLMLRLQSPKPVLSAADQAKVDKHPFGSAKNPVRAEGPSGEREYLSRLRCPEGSAPTFEREGSGDLSPYGSIMDIYNVACGNSPAVVIFIDMYHRGHIETKPVPGFAIVAPGAT